MRCAGPFLERRLCPTALEVTRFFTIAITSSGSRSIATRCGRRVAGADTNIIRQVQGNRRPDRLRRLSREHVHMFVGIRRTWSATSCGASRDGHRIGCRWSSRTCASATGGGISGLAATSPPPVATSRTMSYFSIFKPRTYRRQPVVIQFKSGKHRLLQLRRVSSQISNISPRSGLPFSDEGPP